MSPSVRRAALGRGFAPSLVALLLSSAAAQATETRAPTEHFELKSSERSLGVRGVRSEDGTELRFWSCPARGDCAEREPLSRAHVPEALRALPFQTEVVRVGGVPLLALRLDTDKEPFQVLVGPASRSGPPQAPRVLLEARLREGETLQPQADGQLILGRTVSACGESSGRELFTNVRRLDLTRGDFVRARVSVLDAAAIAQADALTPGEAEAALPQAVAPQTGSTSEALSWVTGQSAGQTPWATLAFRARASGRLNVALEPGPAASFFLARPDRTIQVHVPASDTPRLVTVPLGPEPLPESVKGAHPEGCFLLTTGAAGAPLRSVSFREDDRPFESPESWVRGLSGPDAKSYQNALRTDLAAATRAIDTEFLTLDSAGRAHALEILSEAPGEFALAPLVNAAALGSAIERERATRELELYAPDVVFARAQDAFAATRGPKAPGYALLMARFGAEAALQPLAVRLATARRKTASLRERDEARAVREGLRSALRSAASRSSKFNELEALLQAQTLHRAARVELLRAYEPRRAVLGFSLAPYVAELSSAFADEYVLLELALSIFADLTPELSQRIVNRLAAATDPSFQPVELRAYQARLLELLTERELPKETRARFFRAAFSSLTSPSRVVRKSALLFLRESRMRATPQQAERVLELADRDAWLEVRAEAWLTYGTFAGGVSEPERTEREARIAKRLKPNRDEPIVARALVRALAKSGGPRARAELGKVLAQKGLAEVRGDAAEALGRLCERSAISELTERARVLGSPTSEGDVTLGLASVRALARLAPVDLNQRLAPLMEKKVPGPIRGQVMIIVESTPPSCAPRK